MTYPFTTMFCASRALYRVGMDPSEAPEAIRMLIYNAALDMLQSDFAEDLEDRRDDFDEDDIPFGDLDDFKPEHVFTDFVVEVLGLDAAGYRVAEIHATDRPDVRLVVIATAGGNPMGRVMDATTKTPVFNIWDSSIDPRSGGLEVDREARYALSALSRDVPVLEPLGAWLAGLAGEDREEYAELIARYVAP